MTGGTKDLIPPHISIEFLALPAQGNFAHRVLGGAGRASPTSHTRGLGGFWGPGGSVVEGRCSLGSREAIGEVGPPFEGEF